MAKEAAAVADASTIDHEDSGDTDSSSDFYDERLADFNSDEEEHDDDEPDDEDTILSDTAPGDPYFPKDASDAAAALGILTKWLPSELALTILNEARYWIRSRVTSRQSWETAEYNRDGPARPYITSEPITELDHRVHEIKIDIWSHDQGWSSYPEDHYTYRGSWTWFELGIQRPEGREDILTNIGRLVTNIHARSQTKHHQVIFRRDEDNSWLPELQTGDAITITPHARFPGWANYTRGASIEIYTDPFSRNRASR